MASESTSSKSQGESMASSVHDDEQRVASGSLDLHSQLTRVQHDDDELDTEMDGQDELSGELLSEIRDDIASFDADVNSLNINPSFYEDENVTDYSGAYSSSKSQNAEAQQQSHAVHSPSSSQNSSLSTQDAANAASATSASSSTSDTVNRNVTAASALAGTSAVAGTAAAAAGAAAAASAAASATSAAAMADASAAGTSGGDASGGVSAGAGDDGCACGSNTYDNDCTNNEAVREYINRQSSLEKLREHHSNKSADRNFIRRKHKSDSAKAGLQTASDIKSSKPGRSVMFHAALLLFPLVIVWTVIGGFSYRNVANLVDKTNELHDVVVPSAETSNRLVQDILRISFLVDMTAQSMDMSSAYNNYNNLIYLLKNSPVYGIPELADDVAVLRGKIDNLYKAKAHLHHDSRDIFNTWLVCYGSIKNFLVLTDEYDMYREMLGHDHSFLMQGYSAFDKEISVHLKNVGRFIGPQCSLVYKDMNYTPTVETDKERIDQERFIHDAAVERNLDDLSTMGKYDANHIMYSRRLKPSDIGHNRSIIDSLKDSALKGSSTKLVHSNKSADSTVSNTRVTPPIAHGHGTTSASTATAASAASAASSVGAATAVGAATSSDANATESAVATSNDGAGAGPNSDRDGAGAGAETYGDRKASGSDAGAGTATGAGAGAGAEAADAAGAKGGADGAGAGAEAADAAGAKGGAEVKASALHSAVATDADVQAATNTARGTRPDSLTALNDSEHTGGLHGTDVEEDDVGKPGVILHVRPSKLAPEDAAAITVDDAVGRISKAHPSKQKSRNKFGAGVVSTGDIVGAEVSTATEGVLAVGEYTEKVARENKSRDSENTNVVSAIVKGKVEDSDTNAVRDREYSDNIAHELAAAAGKNLGQDVGAGSAVAAIIDANLGNIPQAQPNAVGHIKAQAHNQNIAARSQLELHQKIDQQNLSKQEMIFHACRAFDTQYAALEVMHEHMQSSLRRFNYAYSDLMSLVISMRFKVDALVKVRPATASADLERAASNLHHNAVIVLMCASVSILFVCVYAVYFFASPITDLHRQIRDFVRVGKMPNTDNSHISESHEILNEIMPILEDYSLLQCCSGELVSYSKALSDDDYIDALTNIHNRAALDKLCEDGRELQPMSAVLVVDIDRFSNFNSNNGLIVGDALLKGITNVLQRHIFNSKDLIFRYNADSFCVVLQQCSVEEMLIFIADISKAIKRLRYKHISKHIKGYDTQPLINTDFYLSVPEPDAIVHDIDTEEGQRLRELHAEVANMINSDVDDVDDLSARNGDDDKRNAKNSRRHKANGAQQDYHGDDETRKYNNDGLSMLGNDAFYASSSSGSSSDNTDSSKERNSNFDASYAQSVAAEAAQAMAATAASGRSDSDALDDFYKHSNATENYVAVSIGVSYADDRMINTSMKLSEHIRMAVQALLSAKCKGGNNTVIYDDTGMGQRRAKLARAAAALKKADEEARAMKDAKELAVNSSAPKQDLDVIVEYGVDSISVKPAPAAAAALNSSDSDDSAIASTVPSNAHGHAHRQQPGSAIRIDVGQGPKA